jgi:lysophospholipase L1-like esterase
MGYETFVRTTAMWLLVGVFALLGGQQPSEAGSGGKETTPRWAPAQGRSSTVHRYVAMGDSYTAGSGIQPDDGTGCLRSDRNYPHRIAERFGAHLDDASCGGATTVNADGVQQTLTGPNPPQLSDIDRRTDLVTISLGVNDAYYSVLIVRCLQMAQSDPLGSPCRQSFQTPDGDQLLSQIPRVGDQVERVIRLAQRKGPNAQVVVIGYPQLVPEKGTCPDLPFATGDYGYLAEYLVDLDNAIRAAARHTGADYVDLLAASEGHDVCAGDDAWVLGALTDSRTMVFHPFANEQRAIAALVAAEVR